MQAERKISRRANGKFAMVNPYEKCTQSHSKSTLRELVYKLR